MLIHPKYLHCKEILTRGLSRDAFIHTICSNIGAPQTLLESRDSSYLEFPMMLTTTPVRAAGTSYREQELVDESKLWFCVECQDDIRALRLAGPMQDQVRLHNCFCVGQLRESWVCFAHRGEGRRQFQRLLLDSNIRKEASNGAWERQGVLCVRCIKHPAVANSSAWICKICRTIGVQP